jgi:AraC-like DNA-binding protein
MIFLNEPVQRTLPLGPGMVVNSPVVPAGVIRSIKTYREAVVMTRKLSNLKCTLSELARYTGMYKSHVTDYFNESAVTKTGKARRQLPAEMIPGVELVLGKTVISQWLAWQSQLTVMEELQIIQAAA